MTTYTELNRSINLNGFDFDPHFDLNLTDDQRDEMEAEWGEMVMDAFNEALAPYGAQILGNGQIVVDIEHAGDLEADLREIVADVSSIDFDEDHAFFTKWAEAQIDA